MTERVDGFILSAKFRLANGAVHHLVIAARFCAGSGNFVFCHGGAGIVRGFLNCFRFCRAAHGAGKGFYALCRAGGCCRYLAVVPIVAAAFLVAADRAGSCPAAPRAPSVIGFCVNLVASGTFLPVLRCVRLLHGEVVAEVVFCHHIGLSLRGKGGVCERRGIGRQLSFGARRLLCHFCFDGCGLCFLMVAVGTGTYTFRGAAFVVATPRIGRCAVTVVAGVYFAVFFLAYCADSLGGAGCRAAGASSLVQVFAAAVFADVIMLVVRLRPRGGRFVVIRVYFTVSRMTGCAGSLAGAGCRAAGAVLGLSVVAACAGAAVRAVAAGCPVTPAMRVQGHRIAVERGLALPRDSADVLALGKLSGGEFCGGLAVQLPAGLIRHVCRHGGGEGAVQIIFSSYVIICIASRCCGDLQRILAVRRSGEGFSSMISSTPRSAFDFTAVPGKREAVEATLAAAAVASILILHRQLVARRHGQGKSIPCDSIATLYAHRGIPFAPVPAPSIARVRTRRGVLIRHRYRATCRLVPLIRHLAGVGITAAGGDGILVARRGLIGDGAGRELEVSVTIALHEVALLRGDKIPRLVGQGAVACRRRGNHNAAGAVNGLFHRNRPHRGKIVLHDDVIIICLGDIGGRDVNVRPAAPCVRDRRAAGQRQISEYVNDFVFPFYCSPRNESLRPTIAPRRYSRTIFAGNTPTININFV